MSRVLYATGFKLNMYGQFQHKNQHVLMQEKI